MSSVIFEGEKHAYYTRRILSRVSGLVNLERASIWKIELSRVKASPVSLLKILRFCFRQKGMGPNAFVNAFSL